MATFTYRQQQAILKVARDAHSWTVECKLNCKAEVLQAEFDALADVCPELFAELTATYTQEQVDNAKAALAALVNAEVNEVPTKAEVVELSPAIEFETVDEELGRHERQRQALKAEAKSIKPRTHSHKPGAKADYLAAVAKAEVKPLSSKEDKELFSVAQREIRTPSKGLRGYTTPDPTAQYQNGFVAAQSAVVATVNNVRRSLRGFASSK